MKLILNYAKSWIIKYKNNRIYSSSSNKLINFSIKKKTIVNCIFKRHRLNFSNKKFGLRISDQMNMQDIPRNIKLMIATDRFISK